MITVTKNRIKNVKVITKIAIASSQMILQQYTMIDAIILLRYINYNELWNTIFEHDITTSKIHPIEVNIFV